LLPESNFFAATVENVQKLLNRKKATVLIVEAFFELAALEFSSFLAVCEMQSFLYEATVPGNTQRRILFFQKTERALRQAQRTKTINIINELLEASVGASEFLSFHWLACPTRRYRSFQLTRER
jgi:hypothetical protein